MAKSPILRRSMEQVLGLPFASPNAFVGAEDGEDAWHDHLLIAQSQHRAIADAIAGREGGRAEAIAREHSRIARKGILRALESRSIRRLPGGLLVRIPEVGNG